MTSMYRLGLTYSHMDSSSDYTSPSLQTTGTAGTGAGALTTTTVDAPQPPSSALLPLTQATSPQGNDYDANHPPNSRLFVVCSKTLNEVDIRDAFSVYGKIQDVYIIRDKTSARASKGVCFIKFFKSSDACRAMEELNGKHIKDCDRPIKVLIAQSRGNEKNFNFQCNSGMGPAFNQSRTGNGTGIQEEENIENFLRLFVAVDKKQSSDEIKDYFAKFGLVDHVHILKDKESGESRGVAFVKFYKASHAALALEEASPEFKAILADPRPQKGSNNGSGGTNNLNHSYTLPGTGVAQTNSHAPLMGGFHGGSTQYTAPSLMSVKNESTINPVHPLTHPGFSHQGHHFSHYGAAAANSVATASNVQPLFQTNVSNTHHPGSAVAQATLMQITGCGDELHSNPTPPWLPNPPHIQPPNPSSMPSFEHVNIACRTLGFNATRIQAFVDPSLSEEQLRAVFDLVPGLDSFHISLDQRKGLPNGIAHATYTMPLAALYAREKLNGLEYPPGFRMVVKFLDEPYNSSNNRFTQPTSNQVLGLQMSRAMGFGLGTFQGVPSANGVAGTNHKSTEISNGGDACQDVENRDESGVRGYLFPSVNAYPVGNAGESYPSFTSSSSGGSGTTPNTANDRNRRKSNSNNSNSQQQRNYQMNGQAATANTAF